MLYHNASAFLTTSIYEGCNLPLLDARATGVPIVATDLPVHREVAGSNSGAVFCLPSATAVATGIQKVLDSNHAQTNDDLSEYNWSLSAAKLVRLMEALL